MKLTKEEFLRKMLHIISGLGIPYIIYLMPQTLKLPFYSSTIIISFFLISSILIEFLRFKNPRFQSLFFNLFQSFLRKEESYKITGSTWIFMSSLICTFIFPSEIASIAICIFILGDAVAAIIGLTIGKTKIGSKTLEGTFGCFVSCLMLFHFLFPYIPGLLNMWNGKIPFFFSIPVSFIVAITELFPIKIKSGITLNDNLTVPFITSIALLISTYLS